eukprot:12207844-Alexandrium_andersonii.AAC.1
MISADADEEEERRFKKERAWAAFWRLHHLLVGKGSDLLATQRLRLLNKYVGPVLLWAAETVRPTVQRVRELLALERSMARMVYRIPRLCPDGILEDVWSWRSRFARKLES